jgi:hypothetical protein
MHFAAPLSSSWLAVWTRASRRTGRRGPPAREQSCRVRGTRRAGPAGTAGAWPSADRPGSGRLDGGRARERSGSVVPLLRLSTFRFALSPYWLGYIDVLPRPRGCMYSRSSCHAREHDIRRRRTTGMLQCDHVSWSLKNTRDAAGSASWPRPGDPMGCISSEGSRIQNDRCTTS